MRESNERGGQIREERQTRMRLEELRTEGIQRRMQEFPDLGDVDFGVFGKRMIAMDQEGGARHKKKQARVTNIRAQVVMGFGRRRHAAVAASGIGDEPPPGRALKISAPWFAASRASRQASRRARR